MGSMYIYNVGVESGTRDQPEEKKMLTEKKAEFARKEKELENVKTQIQNVMGGHWHKDSGFIHHGLKVAGERLNRELEELAHEIEYMEDIEAMEGE